jgi:hypothetical protein
MATTNEAAAGQGHTDTGAAAAAGTTKPAEGATGAAADDKGAAAAAAASAEPGKAGTDAGAAAAAAGAGKGAAAAAGDGTTAEPSKAPEKYTLVIPEKSTIDDGDVKVIEQVARENGWTNEEAQSALDRHNVTLIEQSERFLASTKADPVWGGEQLTQTQALAKSVLDRVEPASTKEGKELRALLDKSGYGNHIRIISFLAKLGKMMAEDQPGAGGGSGGAAKTVEETLYDAK